MKLKTKNMLLAAIFAAVIAICAQIVVPLPFSQVQFSLSVLAVFLCGGILGIRYGCLSVLVYLLLGLCGLPVFGKFMGGPSALLGPTGGYMVAYPLMVLTIGLCRKVFRKQGFMSYFFSMLASLVICYLFGSAWLAISAHMSFGAALMAGVVPFVVFDILKAVLAAYLCVLFRKRLKLV